MRLFKVTLISVLLISVSFGVCGTGEPAIYNQPYTQEEITRWTTWPLKDADTHDTLETPVFPFMEKTDGSRIEQFEDKKNNPDTLLEWFKSLTLDEKVEMYNWWKNESVDWRENCIEYFPKEKTKDQMPMDYMPKITDW